MARFLFAWELGEGLGHLVQIAPLAKELSRRGHQVFAALRDLSRAGRVFVPKTASFLQAPHRTRFTSGNCIDPVRTFPHILFNNGFGDVTELSTMVQAWLYLYQIVQPHVVICDHSPTALLAARMGPAKRVLLGFGFSAPLDSYPMPDLWPFPSDSTHLLAAEDRVLQQINTLLTAWKQPPLERVSQLYAQVNENVLTTYPELDHYAGRTGATYYGIYAGLPGKPPQWPDGTGKKIFAYLKPFPALAQLLAWLKSSGHRVLIYGDGISTELRQQFSAQTLRFEDQPLDMKLVSAQCDASILNATHYSVFEMMRAGKPAFHIPRALEQWIMARLVTRLGVGLDAPPNKSDAIITGIQAVLDSPQFKAAAENISGRFIHEKPEEIIHKIVHRLERLSRA